MSLFGNLLVAAEAAKGTPDGDFLAALVRPAPGAFGSKPEAPSGFLAKPVGACACERTARYGTMCRKCAWRLLSAPPLRAGYPGVSPRRPVLSAATITDRTYCLYQR